MKWGRTNRIWWVGLILVGGAATAGAQEAEADPKAAAKAGADPSAEAEAKPEWLKTPEERRAEEEPQEVITDVPVADIEKRIDRTLARIKGSVEKADFPALELERRRREVQELAALPHPKTLDALKKILGGRYEPEVRGAAGWAMGHMKFERESTAKYLCSRIKREWKEEAVLVGIAVGLGELRRAPDTKEMYSYFNHPSDAVYVSMIACLGAIGEKEHLSKLHEIFGQYAKRSTGGVSVRVDTGAAGTKDQNAAASKGRGMMKKAKVVRRPGALHATQMAVKNITGEDFEFADEMFDWMKAREKELGIELR